jgi:hypothetical protein
MWSMIGEYRNKWRAIGDGEMAAEYWCEQGIEITVEGPEGRFCVKVEKPFARIGHHESSEVVLPDYRTPLRSLYLHATETGVFYVRLASSRSKNDKGAEGWLGPGQILDVGQYQITVQLVGGRTEPDTPLPDFESRDSLPPYPVLMIVHHGETIGYYPLRRKLSIVGRDQHSTLRLADSQVSTSHCILYREKDKLWAIDLFSSNGTSIAGQPLESGLVASGQSLALGDHVKLVFLSAPQMCDNLDDLTLQVTSRMIQFDRRRHWRRLALIAAVGLLVSLAVAASVYFLPEGYLVNLWKRIVVWSQEG